MARDLNADQRCVIGCDSEPFGFIRQCQGKLINC